MRAVAFACAALLCAAVHAQDHPLARFTTLSAPDCVGPGNMITQSAQPPLNATYLRVQHIGDPGTPEWHGQVAGPVTWNVGEVTGFDAPAAAQRGYRDLGLPTGASAFQLWCDGAGFLINTFQFSHAAPLVGEGPSASVSRDFEPPLPLFRQKAALLLEAQVRVPWVHTEHLPTIEGTAQVSFFYYVLDTTSGTVFVHLVGLFDNRAPGVNGSGVEGIGSDGVTAFVSSPLLPVDAAGSPVRFVAAYPGSDLMRFQQAWRETGAFRAHIGHENFAALLERLRSGPLPRISPRPEDYRALSFGILGEVFPGTGMEHNVALGASVIGLAMREEPVRAISRLP